MAAIILNYRTPDLATACLESFAAELTSGCDVALVVDNDSRDGSADAIERCIATRGWSDRARVVRAPSNGGFAAGMNLGIRSVAADTYLLLNSDCVLRPGAIDAMRAALEGAPIEGAPQLAAVGPRLEEPQGRPQVSTFRFKSPLSELIDAADTGVVTRLLRRFDVPLPASGDATASQPPEWISFACVLLKSEAVAAAGPLDEQFFLYFEDMDYCRVLRTHGYRVALVPGACAVHREGGSTRVAETTARRERRPSYFYAARARYFAKHYGRTGLWLANLAWTAGFLIALARRIGGKPLATCRREALDIWRHALRPLRARDA